MDLVPLACEDARGQKCHSIYIYVYMYMYILDTSSRSIRSVFFETIAHTFKSIDSDLVEYLILRKSLQCIDFSVECSDPFGRTSDWG